MGTKATEAVLGSSNAGTIEKESEMKKGFKVPRTMMTNPDIARIINSDEVQSVVRAPKEVRKGKTMKKNPLKNLGALIKLNPYAKTARRKALELQVHGPETHGPLPHCGLHFPLSQFCILFEPCIALHSFCRVVCC